MCWLIVIGCVVSVISSWLIVMRLGLLRGGLLRCSIAWTMSLLLCESSMTA